MGSVSLCVHCKTGSVQAHLLPPCIAHVGIPQRIKPLVPDRLQRALHAMVRPSGVPIR